MYHFKNLAFLLFTLLAFSACNKESNQPDQAPSFTAKLNGQTWTPDTVSAEYRNGRLLLIANAPDGSRIGLSAMVDGAGTFDWVWQGDRVCAYDPGPGDAPFFSNFVSTQTGNLVLSKFSLSDSLVSGEFNCLVEDGTTFKVDTLSEVKFTNIKLSQLAAQRQFMAAKVSWPGFNGFMSSAYINSTTLGKIAVFLADQTLQGGVVLHLSKNANPGLYNLGPTVLNASPAALFTPHSNALFDCTSGTVEIISHDKTAQNITGVFSFSGTDIFTGSGVQVTDGFFSVDY